MGGGLMQLVAYGAQDIYLTGNPQITFFKVVYRRHTNFAMESIEQTFSGSVTLGRRVTATISRNGDLIKDMWLECNFTTVAGSVYGLGNALVKQVEVEIGGQLIDRQYGEWLNVWSELSTPEGKRAGYDEMVGNTATGTSANTVLPTASPANNIDVPLMFWFNRNPGLALPLIALQYHEVKINLDLETGANLTTGSSGSTTALNTLKFWVDYIYLDTDERRRFAQVSHEYLIEQLQFTGDETLSSGTTTKRVDLSFNHPVKELIWVAQTTSQARGGTAALTQPCQFSALTANSATPTFKLQLNGQDRFQERRAEYFLNVQTYKHHTHMPRSNRTLALRYNADDNNSAVSNWTALIQNNSQFIHVYSFALNPEEHQPSGTCNFSRIDNATLVLTGVNISSSLSGILKVYAVNYNVLRIMSGMGGLAYSN